MSTAGRTSRPVAVLPLVALLVTLLCALGCSATGGTGAGDGGSSAGGSSGSGTGGTAASGGSATGGTGGVAASGGTTGTGGTATGGASATGGVGGATGGSGGTGGTATGGTGAGGSGGSATGGSGGSATGGSGGLGGGACCSADDRSVVDCGTGATIETCATDHLCANALCVPDPCLQSNQDGTAVGCEYWAVNIDNIMGGSCFAAFVTNTWNAPIKIRVERGGTQLPVAQFARIPQGQGSALTYQPYYESTGLLPGNVAVLFLVQRAGVFLPLGQPCPAGITPAVTVDAAVHGTGRGQGFRISTTGPAVAYQIFPYGGGRSAITSSTLLLPTAAWDTNYVAVNAYVASRVASNWGRPSLDILAQEDGTQVTISPVNAIVGGTNVAAAGAGVPTTYSLNRGEYVQFTQDAELSGSAIQSNKKVAVFGGNACMNIPDTGEACDSGHQQLPPVRAMGHEYVGVRHKGRGSGTDEAAPWRLVGAVDGTVLTWEPSKPTGAPSNVQQGEVWEWSGPGPFVVRSQSADYPFYVSGHMTGGDSFAGEGDPEFVNIVPTAQYLDQYVFFTDPTYPETSLVVVRGRGTSGAFSDVTLECTGSVLSGWTAVGSYEYTRVNLVTGAFQGVGGCANGRQFMQSQGPFAVTVWGWGKTLATTYVSYAYPAGAGVKPITTRVVPPVPR